MIRDVGRVASVLAVSEIMPAEYRDLSDLLDSHPGDDLPWEGPQTSGQLSGLLHYIQGSIDNARVRYWADRIEHLNRVKPALEAFLSTDAGYPMLLRHSYNRPPFIFVDGSLDTTDYRSLAIVGSRKPSDGSESVAYQIGYKVASLGYDVISGLAHGIDAAAHRGALAAGGRTLAVLGHGIDYPVFPHDHADLANEISAHGALISHFRPGSPTTSSSFVVRNSVISGLASVSLVIEAGERSGSRTEAEEAIRQGRTVLLWQPHFSGERWALWFAEQQGVYMVSEISHVLDILVES